MNMEELETLFLGRLKPYEDRIHQLEEDEKLKDLEILTLKHAIQNLNRLMENLKSQIPASGKPAAGSTKPGLSKAPAALKSKDPKVAENGQEEDKLNKSIKLTKPQTPHGGTKIDKDLGKDAKASKSVAAKDDKKKTSKKDAKGEKGKSEKAEGNGKAEEKNHSKLEIDTENKNGAQPDSVKDVEQEKKHIEETTHLESPQFVEVKKDSEPLVETTTAAEAIKSESKTNEELPPTEVKHEEETAPKETQPTEEKPKEEGLPQESEVKVESA